MEMLVKMLMRYGMCAKYVDPMLMMDWRWMAILELILELNRARGARQYLIRPGDRVILAAYTMVPEADVQSHRPQLIFVNEANRVVRSGPEVPGPQRRNATKGY